MGDGNKAKNPTIAEEKPNETLLSLSLTHLKMSKFNISKKLSLNDSYNL